MESRKRLFRISIALGFLLGLFIISSCTKKNDVININGRVKTLTITFQGSLNYTVTTTYTYDEKGRSTETNSTDGRRTTFSYTDGQAIKMEYDSGATIARDTQIFYLNNDGRAISDNKGYVYTYDTEGHQTAIVNNSLNYSVTNLWANGNLVSTTETLGGLIGVSTYTYYTSTTDYRETGFPYYGKQSKNTLQLSITQGDRPQTTVYAYEYDTEGRISKEIYNRHETSWTDVTAVESYTYY